MAESQFNSGGYVVIEKTLNEHSIFKPISDSVVNVIGKVAET